MGASCQNSFAKQVEKEKKAIKQRFSKTLRINIMLFGYCRQGKTTLAKYYLQEKDYINNEHRYGAEENLDTESDHSEAPDDGIRFLDHDYIHTQNCQMGLKLMNLHEIRNPIALRIFDTPGRDKGEEFFVPGQKVLFRNSDWALLVVNPKFTLINEEMVNKFRRYAEQAELRARNTEGEVKFRLVIVVKSSDYELDPDSQFDEEELNRCVENGVIDKWSIVAMDRSHCVDPLLVQIVRTKVEEEAAWQREQRFKFNLSYIQPPKIA